MPKEDLRDKGAIKNFYDSDVKSALTAAGVGLKESAQLAMRIFWPRAEESSLVARALGVAVPTEAVDAIMALKGDRDKAMALFSTTTSELEKMFDRVPEAGRIDFIDRMQGGKRQPSAELQEIAGALRGIMDEARAEERTAINLGRKEGKQVVLQDKENYFPNRWAKPPGGKEELKYNPGNYVPRRPMEGRKTFLKRQYYTLKGGIEAGGRPTTTNPVRLIRQRLIESYQFTTARRFWYEAGEMGLRMYLPRGERLPEGLAEVDDRIAKVVHGVDVLDTDLTKAGPDIPVEDIKTHRQIVESGRWAMEANSARLLNNYMSKDWIRGSASGRSLMMIKNASTALELALSPFHAVFETIEAASSQASLGMLKIWNQGLRQGDLAATIDGLKDLGTAPVAWATQAREGAALAAYVEMRGRMRLLGLGVSRKTLVGTIRKPGAMQALRDWRAMRQEKAIQRLRRRYQDLDQLIDDMFAGGMKFGQHGDYRTDTLQAVRENWSANNPVGAAFRSLPALSQTIMYPLFQVYIPNLKYGLFLRQYSQQLAENADALSRGDLTREQVARRVVDAVENRLGEMNFDSLFWNRSLKTGLQFLFRSVTWKLGNLRGFGGAIAGQSAEQIDWARRVVGAGEEGRRKQSGRERYIPKLDMNAAWGVSLILTTVILGGVVSRLLSGRWPWEWAAENSDSTPTGYARELYKETMHPRTGEQDNRDKPVRISLPTYMKDIEHLAGGVGGYVKGSFSATTASVIDILQNEDYFGNYVYNPNATLASQAQQAIGYAFPLPFIFSNYTQLKEMGDDKSAWLASLGFPRAKRDWDFTAAEKLADSILKAKRARHTPEEQEEWREERRQLQSGELSPEEEDKIQKKLELSWLVRNFKQLQYDEALAVYDVATPEEQDTLEQYLETKRENLEKNHPDRLEKIEEEAAEEDAEE